MLKKPPSYIMEEWAGRIALEEGLKQELLPHLDMIVAGTRTQPEFAYKLLKYLCTLGTAVQDSIRMLDVWNVGKRLKSARFGTGRLPGPSASPRLRALPPIPQQLLHLQPSLPGPSLASRPAISHFHRAATPSLLPPPQYSYSPQSYPRRLVH